MSDAETTRNHGRRRGDRLILAALAAGATHEEAARRAGVSTKTVQRRIADPTFRAELERVEDESTREVMRGLNGAATTAVATLSDLMGPDVKDSVRLGACRAVLDLKGRYHDRLAVEAELHRLEALIVGNEDAATANAARNSAAYKRVWRLIEEAQARKDFDARRGEEFQNLKANALRMIEDIRRNNSEHENRVLQFAGLPDPCGGLGDHDPGGCEDCREWQEAAHVIAVREAVTVEGRLSDLGVILYDRSRKTWPLRDDTNALLERASRAKTVTGAPPAISVQAGETLSPH